MLKKINRKYLIAFLCVISMMLLFSSCISNSNDTPSNQPEQNTPADTPVDENIPSSEETGPETEETTQDLTDPNEVELPTVDTPPSNSTNTNNSGGGIFVSETTKYWNQLTAVAQAAQTYYNAKGGEKELISHTGRMYSNVTKTNVTISELISLGYLDKSYNSFSCDITLLLCKDVANLDGASTPSGSFKVFTAARQPNGDKYMLASADEKVGFVSEQEYKILLTSYSQNHGTIGRLSPSSEEYDRIVSFLSMYEGNFTNYYIREISKDNKYAIITFSSATNATNVKQHILVNDNGFWEIAYANVEKDYYRVQAINQVLPDFNPALLTSYNLASWKNLLVADQRMAIALLINNGLVPYVEDIVYYCGTADTCYFISVTGERFVTYKSNGNYFAKRVSSDTDAKRFLLNATGVDYGFLILDE